MCLIGCSAIIFLWQTFPCIDEIITCIKFSTFIIGATQRLRLAVTIQNTLWSLWEIFRNRTYPPKSLLLQSYEVM